MKKKVKKKVTRKRKPKEVELVDSSDYGRFKLVVARSSMYGKLTVMEISGHGVLDAVPLDQLMDCWRNRKAIDEKERILQLHKKDAYDSLENATSVRLDGLDARMDEAERQLNCIPGKMFAVEDPGGRKWYQFMWRK